MARRNAIQPPPLAPDEGDVRSTRIRPSEAAIKAALKAMQEAGIPVNKLCVTGSRVEIHAGTVETEEPAEKDDPRLQQW